MEVIISVQIKDEKWNITYDNQSNLPLKGTISNTKLKPDIIRALKFALEQAKHISS